MLGIDSMALQTMGVDLGHERRKIWQQLIFQDQLYQATALL